MKKNDLLETARELNDVMGFEENPIKVNSKRKVADLEHDIREACKQLEPTDNLSEETQEVLTEMGIPFGDALLEGGNSEEEEMEETTTEEETKKKSEKKLSLTKMVCKLICDDISITNNELINQLRQADYNSSKAVILTAVTNTRRTLNYLIEHNMLK